MTPNALPKKWAEEIFKRLGQRYGTRLSVMVEGHAPGEMLENWARELAEFQAAPGAITHALNNLPDENPPTLNEFRALCAGATRAQPVPTEAPTPPNLAADDAVRCAPPRRSGGGDKREWARRLMAREQSGDKLTAALRVMWRAALAEPTKEAGTNA